MSQTSDQSSKSGPDWTKGLTAIAALLGATATFLTALRTLGVVGGVAPKPAPTPLVTSFTVTAPRAELWSFEDDFGDPTSGWDRGADADAEWGYQDGEYRILVTAPDTAVWANMRDRRTLSNLALTVEAHAVAGPVDNQYGVIVRYQNRSNFYLFSVSSDGMYAVQMLVDDQWKDLYEWTASPAIREGPATNLLRVEARGKELSFLVNGELVARVEDDTFTAGAIGLAVGSLAEGGVEVRFDNLLVRELP